MCDELPPRLLKEPFPFQLLHERRIDEAGWISTGCFAAQTFEQSFDTFEIDIDSFLQVLLAITTIDFGKYFRIVDYGFTNGSVPFLRQHGGSFEFNFFCNARHSSLGDLVLVSSGISSFGSFGSSDTS